ncbi:hypothetical protein [Marinicella sp. W31]|uniref:hypothetical protein n=1 Tax=Marinicella sp. W31 TaxID=3023713 RepID=UPI003756F912
MPKNVHFSCENCGFDLDYAVGQHRLECGSCGFTKPIEVEVFNVFHAHPYEDTVLRLLKPEPDHVHHHIQCHNCGAGFDLPENVHADECPYCDSNVVVPVGLQRQLVPDAIIPFNMTRLYAEDAFKRWIGSRWFAPSSLKRLAMKERPLTGTFVPYWAFDAEANSFYIGQRGDNYITYQMVPTRENGKMVMKRQQVVKIRWRPVSGRVFNDFDNVLVMASEKLPADLIRKLGDWDLSETRNYDNDYLSGFRSELYQMGLPRGHTLSKQIMQRTIRETVRRDIGGDHQRISQVNSDFSKVGYKLMLMPLWLSAFRYSNKSYQFAVNGQNGKVYGQRPWSIIKIVATVLFVAVLAGAGYYLAEM